MHKLAKLGLLITAILSTSCSVAMAARKEGVSIDKVQGARTRGQLLACGANVLSSERMPTGELVEVYQFQKERGSAVRALMHGVLDVSTCGLWEVIGTPIEACDGKQYFTLRAYYNLDETINKVELM